MTYNRGLRGCIQLQILSDATRSSHSRVDAVRCELHPLVITWAARIRWHGFVARATAACQLSENSTSFSQLKSSTIAARSSSDICTSDACFTADTTELSTGELRTRFNNSSGAAGDIIKGFVWIDGISPCCPSSCVSS